MIDGVAFAASLATLVAAVAAFWAALVAQKTFRLQQQTNDADFVLSIIKSLDEYWIRYRSCTDDEREFFLGQILTQYEAVCYLLNENLLSSNVRFIVETQIVDIWRSIRRDGELNKIVAALQTDPNTFSHTRRFLKSAGAIL